MNRRPPRSTLDRSSAASDGYKRQGLVLAEDLQQQFTRLAVDEDLALVQFGHVFAVAGNALVDQFVVCLLYTSDAADERSSVDLGGRRILKKKN